MRYGVFVNDSEGRIKVEKIRDTRNGIIEAGGFGYDLLKDFPIKREAYKYMHELNDNVIEFHVFITEDDGIMYVETDERYFGTFNDIKPEQYADLSKSFNTEKEAINYCIKLCKIKELYYPDPEDFESCVSYFKR